MRRRKRMRRVYRHLYLSTGRRVSANASVPLSCRALAVSTDKDRVRFNSVFEPTERTRIERGRTGRTENNMTMYISSVVTCVHDIPPLQMSSIRRRTGFLCRDERRSSSGSVSCSGSCAMMFDDVSSCSSPLTKLSSSVWTDSVVRESNNS